MKIKLCGLFRPEDASAANAAMPDYVGFVFAQSSRRYVTPEQAKALRAAIQPYIAAVGVFVDAQMADIAALVHSDTIQAVQLHGGEDAGYITRLRVLLPDGVPIIRAIRMNEGQTADAVGADMLLLDSGAGSGTAFDWTYIPPIPVPWLLAGGITPENARDAMRTGAWGLDVSGGIETNGVKDSKKMRDIVRIVRGV